MTTASRSLMPRAFRRFPSKQVGNPKARFGTRIPENITLDKLRAACPQLTTMPACTEEAARAAGAAPVQSVALTTS
jgi:hypothetical protein